MSRVGPREPGIVGLATRQSIADVVWVANTRHGPGGHWFARVTRDDGDHDHLRTASDAVRYLADHGVAAPSDQPADADLAELAAIREMVRGLRDPAAGWTPEVLRILAGARFTVDESRGVAAIGDGRGRGWSAFIADLMPPLLEVVRLRDRLEICGNPVCRLVFIDGSRSGTRRWCDDAGCSNRDRVRRHRMAARGAASRGAAASNGRAAATMLP